MKLQTNTDYFHAVYASRRGATKAARAQAIRRLFEIACNKDQPAVRDAARKRLREEGIVVS
jgi:hypothetical protein